MDIIKIKIDCQKIDKLHLYKGTKGTYLDCDLLPNKAGTDQYGNDYMVVQQVSKDQRMAGVKGAIIGNAKIFRRSQTAPAQASAAPAPAPASDVAEDDVPF